MGIKRLTHMAQMFGHCSTAAANNLCAAIARHHGVVAHQRGRAVIVDVAIDIFRDARVALGNDRAAVALRRKAQIITPKDASRIAYELGIGPGDRVLESGIGSGAATMALAWNVGHAGRGRKTTLGRAR